MKISSLYKQNLLARTCESVLTTKRMHTVGGDIFDGDVLLFGHETKNSEHDESSEKTCRAVDHRHDHCIATQRNAIHILTVSPSLYFE